MRCTRVECFAYSLKEQNCCTALTTVEVKCKFYKTKACHASQKQDLIGKGKPYYEPAKTYTELLLLKRLLGREDDERSDYLDKTKQEHS